MYLIDNKKGKKNENFVMHIFNISLIYMIYYIIDIIFTMIMHEIYLNNKV